MTTEQVENEALKLKPKARAELAEKLLRSLEVAVAHIREHPEASPVIIQDVRRKVLKRFPYSIITR
jgi:hypothetical protein